MPNDESNPTDAFLKGLFCAGVASVIIFKTLSSSNVPVVIFVFICSFQFCWVKIVVKRMAQQSVIQIRRTDCWCWAGLVVSQYGRSYIGGSQNRSIRL